VSEDKTAEFRIDEADRVIARADRINKQLTEQILDIGDADPVLYTMKADVKTAHVALNGGQTGLVSTQLTLIKKDYRDLAAAYRDIAVSASLPEGMADILKATSISLEFTADRIGES
jgi:glutamate racemase